MEIGKRILITGGSTGIGRETAILLASKGAKVLVTGRHQEQIDETLNAMDGAQGSGYGIAADLAEEAGIRKIFAYADQELGGLDCLVNNAALAYQSIMEGSYKDWQYIVNTNLLGYMACVHEAVKRMEIAGEGHIVNIGSMSADVRESNSSVYVATKSGIQGFSEALRKELNPKGIKVSLIEPGAVDTDMQEGSEEEKLQKIAHQEMIPAREIAAAVLYCLDQPKHTDIVNIKIRPHLQLI